MIIKKKAYPRGGLVGNPSDGYYGKTIAFTFRNFCAEVILYETPELEILPNTRDHSRFSGICQLAEDVRLFGYYGGIRLLKAAVKAFHDYCRDHGIQLHSRNFTLRYSSDIPHLVGLAGSSAIITACLRALMAFYGVSVPKPELANLVLTVEKDELLISAGLQDRVAQVYQGLVYMNFDEAVMKERGFGDYVEMSLDLLPPLYIAYRDDLSQGSEIVHSDLTARFRRGDRDVLDAVADWVRLTDRTRDALQAGQGSAIGNLLNENFDLRRRVCQISDGNIRMVEAARGVGASAKFTGSGGAIVGTYTGEAMFEELQRVLEPLEIRVIKPIYALPTGEMCE